MAKWKKIKSQPIEWKRKYLKGTYKPSETYNWRYFLIEKGGGPNPRGWYVYDTKYEIRYNMNQGFSRDANGWSVDIFVDEGLGRPLEEDLPQWWQDNFESYHSHRDLFKGAVADALWRVYRGKNAELEYSKTKEYKAIKALMFDDEAMRWREHERVEDYNMGFRKLHNAQQFCEYLAEWQDAYDADKCIINHLQIWPLGLIHPYKAFGLKGD